MISINLAKYNLKPNEEAELSQTITNALVAVANEASKRGRESAYVWKSVEDELPEKDVDVLCSRGNHIGALMDVYTYMGDDKWEDTYGNRSYTEDEGITHWMPLPQPPKGE